MSPHYPRNPPVNPRSSRVRYQVTHHPSRSTLHPRLQVNNRVRHLPKLLQVHPRNHSNRALVHPAHPCLVTILPLCLATRRRNRLHQVTNPVMSHHSDPAINHPIILRPQVLSSSSFQKVEQEDSVCWRALCLVGGMYLLSGK